MKISQLTLEYFGKFTKDTIELAPNINVIYGPNEAGKSTLQEAVRSILFGFGKSPKQFPYRSWKGESLRLKASLICDDGEIYEVERSLGKAAEGRLIKGVMSTNLGNEPLAEFGHLNRELFSQVYGLNTANTSEFQQLDWTDMIRNMIQSSGTDLFVPTQALLSDLADEGNLMVRLNGRGNFALKTLESDGRALEQKRRELLRQREDVSHLILRKQKLEHELSESGTYRQKIKKDLSDMESFIVPWTMIGAPKNADASLEHVAHFYQDPQKSLELMNQTIENNHMLTMKEKDLASISSGISAEWQALLGPSKMFETSDLQWLTSIRGEQGVMLARSGRALKQHLKGAPRVRLTAGLMLMGLSAAGWAFAEWAHVMDVKPMVLVIMAVGIAFTVDAAVIQIGHQKKTNKIKEDLDALFDRRLPDAAVDTLDEVYFERLGRLSKECSRLSEQWVALETLKQSIQEAVLTLDRMSGNHVVHEVSHLQEQRDALSLSMKQGKQSEEDEKRLHQALGQAELETGMTMEKVLDKLRVMGGVSLQQGIDELKKRLEESSKDEMALHAEFSSVSKEIEMRSQLEALPDIEAAIRVNRDDIRDIKLKRDKLTVLECFIRKMERDYNKAHQPDLIREASRVFRHLSAERYERLYLEEPLDIQSTVSIEEALQVETEGGILKLLQMTSTGTREQLYMALKLAIANQLETGRERLPLMLDEVFAHWDRERTARCLEVLVKEAQIRQIVIFTCHRDFAEFAVEKTGGQLIEVF